METESCTDSREMVVKREVASPTSLSGSAAEDEEHSTPHNKAHGVIGPASLKMNSSDVHKTNNLKIKIKLEDKSKCSKCLVSIFFISLKNIFLEVFCNFKHLNDSVSTSNLMKIYQL